MDNQRLILFIALAGVLMLIWMKWEETYRPAPAPGTISKQPADKSIPSVPEARSQQPQSSVAAQSVERNEISRGQAVRVRTDLLDIVIDSNGADIHEAKLLKHPISAKKTDEPFVLQSYSQDFGVMPGSMPDIVVRPRTSEEISGIMQIANEFKVPPDPWTPPKRRGRPSKETLRLIEQWCF